MDTNFIRKTLELAFTSDGEGGIQYEVEDKGDEVVNVVVKDAKGEEAYVVSVIESIGLVPVPDLLRREHASTSIEYTNDPEVIANQYEGDVDPEVASAIDDDDDVVDLFETANSTIRIRADGSVEIATKGDLNITAANPRAEIARSLDAGVSDESKLKVLGNPEMMKLANKIFDMISPGEDKSNYAAFLYNLDDFFLMHKPDSSYVEEEDEDDDAELEPTTSVAESASALQADLVRVFGDVEVASAFMDSLGGFMNPELAKKRKKNPRSALLSVLMKAMSGEHGIGAVNAWEAQNVEELKTSMQAVGDTVVGVAAEQWSDSKD